MPADVTLDLTGLWHRETELKGAYTYGTEHLPDGRTVRTFDLAIETANAVEAERLLSATYPLSDHVDAIAHAATAGRRGAVKIAFDLRKDDQLMPRPGFVLDVDRSTPPTLFWHGEGFRSGEAARRPQPGDLRARAARRDRRRRRRHPDGAAATRSTWTRCRRCCSPA